MQPVKDYTFDNFITGKSNLLAFSAAKTAADSSGILYNPILIFGGSGLGKTHLLNAICLERHAQAPDSIVCFCSADELVREMVKAIQDKRTDVWREKMLSSDILLIDDIHILTGKRATQAKLVSLLRACVGRGRQVVMTSSVAPDKLPVLQSSLRADFALGLSADIQPLDPETGLLIVREKAERCGLWLSDESQECIVSHAEGEVRRIEGIIARLHAENRLRGSSLDFAAVKRVCEDHGRAPF